MEIFRTYDIRGEYPNDLNKDVAYNIGRAFVEFLKCKNIVVGHDMRLSSEELKEGLIKGIIDQGCDVIDIGLSSTDMLYFAVAHFGYDAGINITASHCSKELNGFKLTSRHGMPVSMNSGLDKVREIYNNKSFSAVSEKGNIVKKNILDDFVSSTRALLSLNALKTGKRKIKAVLDAGNGMAGMIAEKMFFGLDIEIIPLFFELDGNFPNHEANPMLPEARESIIRKIKEENADLGIMWDGDSDRVMFFDENARPYSSDFTTGILAKDILSEPGNENKAVVYDLRSSWFVKNIIEQSKGIPIMERVGYAFIKQTMKKHKAVFGGEMSGHFFFNIDNGYNENTYLASLRILKMLAENVIKMSELYAETRNYFTTGEINFRTDKKQEIIDALKEKYKGFKQYFLDGLSVESDEWHFNVRPSANDPVLRFTLEGKTKEIMEQKKEEIIKVIDSFL